MGQQQPLIPPQGGQGMPNMSASGMPDLSSMLQGMTPEQLQQGMAALADPKIMAQVQQQLANPNAGDMFNNAANNGAAAPAMPGQAPGVPGQPPPGMQDPAQMMPITPQGMVLGAAAGIPLAAGLRAVADVKEGSSPLIKLARKVDNLRGVKRLSNWLENSVLSRFKGEAADRVLARITTEDVEKQLIQRMIDARSKHLPEAFVKAVGEHATLAGAEGAVNELLWLQNAATSSYGKTLGTKAEFIGAIEGGLIGNKHVPADLLKRMKAAGTIPEMRAILSEAAGQQMTKEQVKVLEGLRSVLKSEADNLIPTYRAQQEMLRILPGQAQELARRMPELEKIVSKKTAEKLAGATTLQQVRSILPASDLQKSAVKTLLEEVETKSTGPIGRAILSTGQTFNRVFSGELFREGMGAMGKKKVGVEATEAVEKAAATTAETTMKSSGRFLAPGLMGAVMIGTAFTSAQKAEKGDKLKTFMHDFLGTGLFGFLGWEVGRKFLRSSAVMETATKIVPFLGKTLPKVLPLIGGATWGRVAAEVLAMFVLAKPFEKFGEKISDTFFGKPQSKIKEAQEKAAAKAAKNGGAQPGAQAGQQPFNQAGAPGGLQPPPKGVFNQFTNPGGGGTPAAPGISITPDQIRNSTAQAAEQADAQTMLSNIGGSGGGTNDNLGGSWDPMNMFQPNTH